jgi:DNA-binding SARP family transcriptional activator
MRFRILGPLEVQAGGGWTGIGAPKWRSVLAALLLNSGQIVSTDTLISELWGDDPPAKATNLVSIYILRLRKLIGDTEGKLLVTRSPGYQLRLEPGDLDAQLFVTLLSDGRQALSGAEPDRAAQLLTAALALWRGNALADVPSSALVDAESERMGELRTAALELRIGADLACARHAEVIPELHRQIADNPLREGFWLLLMRALDGAGRRAEALNTYGKAREVIADQLGVDPGPELQQLFQDILTADGRPAARSTPKSVSAESPTEVRAGSDLSAETSAARSVSAETPSGSSLRVSEAGETSPVGLNGLAQPASAVSADSGPALAVAPGSISAGAVPPAAAASGPTAAAPFTTGTMPVSGDGSQAPHSAYCPAQLPADTADFTGRDQHVKHLCDQLSGNRSEANPGAVPVALVAGAGGLGKTALAVHAAHRLRPEFPDGQLYVDLLGVSPHPLAPGDVLARFLRDLGVDGARVPVSEDERAALYRTRLTGRRMLIVLDNARDAAQVRPLLPGSSSCAVLVTTRSRMPDLARTRLVDLDVLDDHEALTLFARIVGEERAAAEPDATAELLLACAGLPLAIRISAARLAARSGWTIRVMADRLRHEHRRLDELKAGDLAVRASFQVSFASLPANTDPGGIDPARAFRLLGLWQGPNIALAAAAALFGTTEDSAADALEILVDAHLLGSPAPDRYRFHDLLRVYAAEQARAEEPKQHCEDAVHRLLTWYLRSADAAAQVVSPHRYQIALAASEDADASLTFADAEDAFAWYDSERANVVAATYQASSSGMHEVAWRLPASLFPVFNRRGNWADCVTTNRVALESSRMEGNQRGEAWVLSNLGEALGRKRMKEGIGYLEDSLAIRREIGDRVGEAQATHNLADVHYLVSGPSAALEHAQRSLEIQRAIGYSSLLGASLNNLGEIYLELGHVGEAVDCLQEARGIYTRIQAVHGEGHTLLNLGRAYLSLSRHSEAFECLQQALTIQQASGDQFNQGFALKFLGQAQRGVGQFREARKSLTQALALFESLGDDVQAVEVRTGLAALDGETSRFGARP